MSFGHYYKFFEKKTPKFNSKNTTPGEQKGKVIVYYGLPFLQLLLLFK